MHFIALNEEALYFFEGEVLIIAKKGSKMTVNGFSNIRHTWPETELNNLQSWGLAGDRKRNHILNDTEQHSGLGGGQRWNARLTDMEPVSDK